MIGKTLAIITPDEDIQTLLFIGDVGHFFGLKLHYSLIFIFASIICLSYQLIHYLNHRNGIQNKFIGDTQELSEEEILKLKNWYTKVCKIIQKNNTYLIPTVCVIVTFTPLSLHTTLFKALVFGIPLCIHYMLWDIISGISLAFNSLSFILFQSISD